MLELLEANWIAVVAVLLLALLIAWWIWGRGRTERVRSETPDVLSPGAAPAQRNTLLVEAIPSVAVVPPMGSIGMPGLGEVIAAAAAQEVVDTEPHDDAAQAGDQPAATPAPGPADDLTRIKGIGPKLNTLLGQLGVTRYDQIAAWSDADIAAIDARLGVFQGRIVRDNWVEQCRLLAAGDIAVYEAKFGKM
jgi:predicted flap endonuclease-1-like 5' DNA nuclease